MRDNQGALTWPGQFNLDFFGMLSLSASYLVWRHHFTPVGLLAAAGELFRGAPFPSLYLFAASTTVRGEIVRMLIGDVRAAGLRD